MDRKEEREFLRRNGFAEAEMNRLSRFRRDYNERAKKETAAANRRLEFVRWLVVTGKLTEQIA
jgi:hypothetical protein